MIYNIGSFTQTYGNDREVLWRLRSENVLDHKIRNRFKINLFSFHNSDDDFVDRISNKYIFPYYNNQVIIKQKNNQYTDCVKNAIDLFVKNNVENFFFAQDDGFCISPSEDFLTGAFDMFFENNMKHLHLDNECKQVESCCDKNVFYSKNGLKIWYNDLSRTSDKLRQCCMNDSPFIANIDFLKKYIYDEGYFRCGRFEPAEAYIYTKIHKDPIERYQVETPLWHNINIVGPNSMKHYTHEHIVNELFSFMGSKF